MAVANTLAYYNTATITAIYNAGYIEEGAEVTNALAYCTTGLSVIRKRL